MFELIDLHTRDYDATADVDPLVGDKTIVATARIPAMKPRPDILVWGARSFVKTEATSSRGNPVYVEAFACTVVHTMPSEYYE